MSKLKQTIIASTISITVLLFVVIILNYVTSINQILLGFTVQNLEDEINSHRDGFNELIVNEITSLQRVASTLSIFEETEDNATYEYLKSVENFSVFNILYAVNRDGYGTTSEGEVIDLSKEDYFNETMNGKIVVTEKRTSLTGSNEDIMVITMPLYYEGTVEGVLAAEYPVEEIVDSIYFENGNEIFIVNPESEIIVECLNKVDGNQDGEHLEDYFKEAIFEKGSLDELLSNVKAGRSGSAVINIKGIEEYVEYRPLNVNGWILVATISSDLISADVENIVEMISILTIGIIFVFMALIGYVFVSRQNYISDIEKVAYYDTLTGLPNIHKFKIEAANLMKKNPEVNFAIVKLDIINFKTINAMYDFDMGNKVIKAIANVLIDAKYGDEYLVARVGIDEFLLFSKDFILKDLDSAKYIYEAAFKRKLPAISDHNIEFRYGRYILEENETNIDAVLDKVTLAHASAKGKSAEYIYDYDETVKTLIIKQTEIQNKMYSALEEGEFKAYLQPKFNILTNEISGAEALVRWVEKDGKMIMPNDFIPIFETNGFITRVDIYVLTLVCKKIRKWLDASYKVVPISVNFSRMHFNNENFIDEILYVANKYNTPKELIEIEITESVMFDNEEKMLLTAQKLREEGFKVSIDDFGSGYSSLGQLKNILVDIVKIDRSFFTGAQDEKKSNLVVASTIDMLQKLNLKTVAEGVETKEQVEFLKEIGCEMAQGYFYSRPVSVEEFEDKYVF